MTARLLVPLALLLAVGPPALVRAAQVLTVVQSGRAFSVREITLKRGDSIRFVNSDSFLHHVGTSSRTFSFTSDEQAPGKSLDVPFPVAGSFTVRCEIHPRMSLAVTVE